MHYSNCNPQIDVIWCLVDRFVITRLRDSASRHIILSVRRKLPRIEARVATFVRARMRACSARLHTRCTAPWPSGVIHSQRPCRRSPSTFIMCALARSCLRARTPLITFLHRNCREKERRAGGTAAWGRGYRRPSGGRRREREIHTHGRSI